MGALALCLVCTLGCHSTEPGSASFASVNINNRSLAEIQQAAIEVFSQDGYRATPSSINSLVFEKRGSAMDDIAYNGVVGTHYGQISLIRVKTQIVNLGANSSRLQCQAYTVRDAADSFFAEEIAMSSMRSGPFQKLLRKTADKLK